MFGLRKYLLEIQGLFSGFDSLAKKNTAEDLPEELNPIFIVGAPRSGSTLLFQLLIRHTKLIYISNLMALFPNQMIKIFLLKSNDKDIFTYKKQN